MLLLLTKKLLISGRFNVGLQTLIRQCLVAVPVQERVVIYTSWLLSFIPGDYCNLYWRLLPFIPDGWRLSVWAFFSPQPFSSPFPTGMKRKSTGAQLWRMSLWHSKRWEAQTTWVVVPVVGLFGAKLGWNSELLMKTHKSVKMSWRET